MSALLRIAHVSPEEHRGRRLPLWRSARVFGHVLGIPFRFEHTTTSRFLCAGFEVNPADRELVFSFGVLVVAAWLSFEIHSERFWNWYGGEE